MICLQILTHITMIQNARTCHLCINFPHKRIYLEKCIMYVGHVYQIFYLPIYSICVAKIVRKRGDSCISLHQLLKIGIDVIGQPRTLNIYLLRTCSFLNL